MAQFRVGPAKLKSSGHGWVYQRHLCKTSMFMSYEVNLFGNWSFSFLSDFNQRHSHQSKIQWRYEQIMRRVMCAISVVAKRTMTIVGTFANTTLITPTSTPVFHNCMRLSNAELYGSYEQTINYQDPLESKMASEVRQPEVRHRPRDQISVCCTMTYIC